MIRVSLHSSDYFIKTYLLLPPTRKKVAFLFFTVKRFPNSGKRTIFPVNLALQPLEIESCLFPDFEKSEI